jgi:hypothetical protein
MAKKPKLSLEPVDLPTMPEIDPALGFMDARRAASGRILGRRQRADSSGLSELFVADPGAPPRKVALDALNFGQPDLCEDGSRALLASRGNVLAIALDADDRLATIWAGGAPLHDAWQGIMQALFAGPERVLLVTGWRTVLMGWETEDQLAPIAAVAPLERCFIAWPLLGGRFQVLQSSSQNFLCAIKGSEVHVVKKAAKKKEYLTVSQGRVFLTAPGLPTVEVLHLEELYAAL